MYININLNTNMNMYIYIYIIIIYLWYVCLLSNCGWHCPMPFKGAESFAIHFWDATVQLIKTHINNFVPAKNNTTIFHRPNVARHFSSQWRHNKWLTNMFLSQTHSTAWEIRRSRSHVINRWNDMMCDRWNEPSHWWNERKWLKWF